MQEEVCGILVDVKEYREHDALLKVLCEDGSLLSLSARGVRKVTSKNAPAVQLFTLARLQLNYQQTASIQSTPGRNYKQLSQNSGGSCKAEHCLLLL